MSYSELLVYAKKYFDTDLTYDALLKLDTKKLGEILVALEPSLEKFYDKKDENGVPLVNSGLKKKVGRVFFGQATFSKFKTLYSSNSKVEYYEPDTKMVARVKSLFDKTTAKGINPYEICYASVLNEAELFVDKNGEYSKEIEKSSNFLSVYAKLKSLLDIEDRQVNTLYEKCSSLLYRTNVDKVEEVINRILNLSVDWTWSRSYSVFSYDEVREIFRNKPYLLTIEPNKIQGAFDYIQEKCLRYLIATGEIKVGWAQSASDLEEEADVLKLCSCLKDWITNSSMLLAINSYALRRKEVALYNHFYDIFRGSGSDRSLGHVMFSIFKDPTKISAINKVSNERFFEKNEKGKINFKENINTICELLEWREEDIVKFFSQNVQIYGVPNRVLKQAVTRLLEIDAENKNTYLVDKFLELGDTAVPYLMKKSTGEFVEALKANETLVNVKLYNMTKGEIARTFFNIFADDNSAYREFSRLYHMTWLNDDLSELALPEEKLDRLAELLTGDVASKAEINKLVGEIGSDVSEYFGKYIARMQKIYSAQEPEVLNNILARFDEDIEKFYDKVEQLYALKIGEVRGRYKNPDELHDTFVKNAEVKLNTKTSPRRKILPFAKKFYDILKSADVSSMANNLQLSVFGIDTTLSQDVVLDVPSKAKAELNAVSEKLSPYTAEDVKIR